MISDPKNTSDGSPSTNPPSCLPCEVTAPITPIDVLCNIAILLDALYCGALLIDRTGRLVHVNRRLCDMMQRSPSELIGRTLLDLYPEGPGREVIQHALDHFNEAREQEFYIPCRNGVQLPVIVSGRHLEGPPPLGDHRIITVIGIAQQKQAEHEVQERYRDIATLSDTILAQALELKNYSRNLEERVRLRTQELHTANMEAIFMLAVAAEAKDQDTGLHVRRIEHSARLIAQELGLPQTESDRIAYSAILHDVGKIHVPDALLLKPAALSDEEWVTMRQHTTAGERILSREPFFDVARDIARSHHENWDGSGYPDGISANSIPLPARIVRVADVYDALTSARPYKTAWSKEKAVAEIREGISIQFDPDVVAAFLKLYDRNELPAASPAPQHSAGEINPPANG